MPVASSLAALVVKVSPSTWSGVSRPVATSQTTLAAITVVLPEPAPAITTAGSSGAVMAANCCAENVNSVPITARNCSGVLIAPAAELAQPAQLMTAPSRRP